MAEHFKTGGFCQSLQMPKGQSIKNMFIFSSCFGNTKLNWHYWLTFELAVIYCGNVVTGWGLRIFRFIWPCFPLSRTVNSLRHTRISNQTVWDQNYFGFIIVLKNHFAHQRWQVRACTQLYHEIKSVQNIDCDFKLTLSTARSKVFHENSN